MSFLVDSSSPRLAFQPFSGKEEEWMEGPDQGPGLDSEIVGRDDRAPVVNTLAAPYRFICRLRSSFRINGKDKLFQGTGTLIGPRHILTVAHSVRMWSYQSQNFSPPLRATQVEVFPAADGFLSPYGSVTTRQYHVASMYEEKANRRFDYALIVLPTPISELISSSPNKVRLGYWGEAGAPVRTAVGPVSASSLTGASVHVSGYPVDKTAEVHTQWKAVGSVVDPAPSGGPENLFYTPDTCGGHSGSPLWTIQSGFPRLVAVHRGRCNEGADRGCVSASSVHCPGGVAVNYNVGVRLSPVVWDQVQRWISSNPSSPTPPVTPPISPPPPVTPPISRPLLRQGSRGAEVSDLQQRLNRWMDSQPGSSLTRLVVDGIFGSRTDGAVRAFQRMKGLQVDGIVGPQTWGSLLAG